MVNRKQERIAWFGSYQPFLCTLWLLLAVTVHQVSAQPSVQSQDSLAEKSRLAKKALLDGQYATSIDLYRDLVRALPDNPGLRVNLAVALVKAGHPSAAIPELERVVRVDPSSAPAWLLLGLAYQQLNQPQKAILPLREAVRLDSKNRDAMFELADAELTTGDVRGAAKDFGALARTHPDFPKAWEGLGRAYLALSEHSFQQLEKQASNSAFYFALLARSRASDERYSEALSLYASALERSSAIPGLHLARAEIYRRTKHDDWAAIEQERESRLPKPDCTRQPAACAYLSADWQRALMVASQLHSPENLYWSTLACSQLAEESFNKLANFPQSPGMHSVMADYYQRIGRRLDAVAEWRKALELNPSDRMLQARLAESLFRAREYPEAERILTALVAQQPENGDCQYLFGNVLLQLKRDEDALPHLVAATRLLPNLLPAQEALGRVYLDLDKPGEAVTHLEKARPLDDGSISFALSSAYRKLGRQQEAHAALARYQALSKQRPATSSGNEGAIPPP